jgi:hypothetical protein
VRRHFEGAQLDQTKPAAAVFGGVEFVDAELGAVGVAGRVDGEVAEEVVAEPR